MEQEFESIFAEITARSRLIEWALSGGVTEITDTPFQGQLEIPVDPDDGFSGPVIDENSDTTLVVDHLKLLLEKHLGSTFDEAKVVATMESTDQKTTVEIFDTPLGSGGQLYLSRWRNEGEKPSYILWPKGMYDVQIVGDEETEAPFQLTEGEWK